MNEQVKSHFINLYFLALSDGNFAPEELETILKIAEEKGLSKQEFESIITNPTDIKIGIPEDFLEKIVLLYDFVRVILADNEIEESEKKQFLKFCNQFGFGVEESEELFDWLIGLAKKELSFEQVKQEINLLINN
ncbi:TerB family tellurite resistance protein [Bergeyella zoohelcum]|uniref:Tellurite resistance protein TerB n=1 Tax=Bergeyella zoohelcum TaxID=1015 RepID=A0A7Z8YPD9_9FLAO|nr:TerB family tellurite resistance protein [Bergeyella zoohelcum]VDH05173.1 Tellurite resistance protein TerB [Bergeyella zoohelcum]